MAGNNADSQSMAGGRTSHFRYATSHDGRELSHTTALKWAGAESSLLVSVLSEACHATLAMH